jgi:RNA polymerase sigma factor (sigma-70 family)
VNGLADGTLARQAASGDRAAFAALYDRFNGEIYGFSLRMLSNPSDAADVTQDVFVRAIEKLPQLREPDRVRAWLFTIARHECFARTKRRSRSMATDPLDLGAETASTSRSTVGLAEANELTQLVWDAAKGLAPEDRAVLDLKLKRDLDGAELAEALGVPHDQLHKVTGRAMERFERSVISLVLARGARKDCSVLAGLVESNGTDEVEHTPVLRKRIARHAEDCDACERRRKMLVNPFTMVASAHEAGPSAALRDRVLDAAFSRSLTGTSGLRSLSWRADGFPKARSPKRKLLAIAALVCVLTGGLFASGVGSDDAPKATVVSQSDSPETTVGRTSSSVVVVSSAAPTVATPSSLAVAIAPTIPVAPTSSSTSTTVLPTTRAPIAGVPAAVIPQTSVVPSTKAVPLPTTALAPLTTSSLAVPLTTPAPKPTTRPTVQPTTRKPKPTSTTTLKPRATTTKPALATPTNPIAAPTIEAPAPPTVEITTTIPTVPAIIFPDAVPLEPARVVTTAPLQTTATPAVLAPSTTATPTPIPTTTVAIVTATTQASPNATQPSITTTTLKCSLTQAGCGQQTPPPTTPTTTTIALRLTPVCCLTTVNPGILFTTTTKASVVTK